MWHVMVTNFNYLNDQIDKNYNLIEHKTEIKIKMNKDNEKSI